MKFGIVVFPGSNCDHDAYHAVTANAGADAEWLWHKDTKIPKNTDCVVLPGGFSYGDYLRAGAIARFSPIMNEVIKFGNSGGYIIGICNGFQILTEAGLLPGALLRNRSLNFICKDVYLKTMNNSSVFTSHLEDGEIMRIPVAHGEGNYFADADIIKKLEDGGRIAFKYCSESGSLTDEANANGSLHNIAGIYSENRNILGMMPHPERYSDDILSCSDGLKIFKSILSNFT